MRCDFRLVIVKGLVEHGNGDVYFGSLMGYIAHWARAVNAGWVLRADGRETLTEAGREIYVMCKLDTLPNTPGRRAYLWDWSNIPPPNV